MTMTELPDHTAAVATATTEVVIFATYSQDADGYPSDQPTAATYADIDALVEAGWVSQGERYELRDGVPAFVTTLTKAGGPGV